MIVGLTFQHATAPDDDVWEVVEIDWERMRAVLRGTGGRVRVHLGDLWRSAWREVRVL